jgi:hypothetical protein
VLLCNSRFVSLINVQDCAGPITRPEESYRVWCVWVWSWSLDNEESLAQWGLLRHWGKKWERRAVRLKHFKEDLQRNVCLPKYFRSYQQTLGCLLKLGTVIWFSSLAAPVRAGQVAGRVSGRRGQHAWRFASHEAHRHKVAGEINRESCGLLQLSTGEFLHLTLWFAICWESALFLLSLHGVVALGGVNARCSHRFRRGSSRWVLALWSAWLPHSVIWYRCTIFFPWRQSPQWARASSLSRLHDHTETHYNR